MKRYRIKICKQIATATLTHIPQIHSSGLWWDLYYGVNTLTEQDARDLIQHHKEKPKQSNSDTQYIHI